PQRPLVGSDAHLRIGTRNLGNSDSGASVIELRRLDGSSTEILQRRPLQVEAGEQVVTEFSWRPQDTGTHRPEIVIDPDDQLAEVDESNNLLVREVEVGRAEGVDLFVLAGSTQAHPAQPLQGGTLRVAATLGNQGGQSSGAYGVALYLGDPAAGGLRL